MITMSHLTKLIGDYETHLRPSVVDSTLDGYINNLFSFQKFAENDGGELDTKLVGRWITNLITVKKLKASSVRKLRKHVKAFFEYCEDQGEISSNPVNLKKLPKLPPNKKTEKPLFKPDEYKKLLEYLISIADTDWHDATVVGYHSGLRISDVAGLRWDELNWTEEYISKIPLKTIRYGQVVTIPMSPELFEVLKRRKENPDDRFFSGEYVFPAFRQAYDHSRNSLSDAFSYRCMKAGVPANGFHRLRHTFVSKLANNDVSYGTISSITGQSLKTIQGYHHVSLEAQRRAIAKAA